MADQVRTMSVRAIMDSGDYARGARIVTEANREITASGDSVRVTLASTDSALTKAGSGSTRIANSYIDGARALATFQKDLKALITALETGQLSADQASAAYTGMVQKFGLIADGAHLAGQGVNQLGAIVNNANDNFRTQAAAVDLLVASYRQMAVEARAAQAADNAQNSFNRSFGIAQPSANSASSSASVFEEQFRQQEEAARRTDEINRLRAQQTGSNFGADLNSRFGIDDQNSGSARASASVFEEVAREAELYAQKADALKSILDPIAASQQRLNAELIEYGILLNRREIDTQQYARAEELARDRHDKFVESLGRGGGNDREGQFRRQNLVYQAFDVSGGLASGQSLSMIAAQQGPQILQEYAAGGLASAKEDLLVLKSLAGSAITAITPLGAAFGALAIAAGAYYYLTREEAKSTDDVLKEHEASIRRLKDAYGEAVAGVREYAAENKNLSDLTQRSNVTQVGARYRTSLNEFLDETGVQRNQRTIGGETFFADSEFKPYEAALRKLQDGAKAGKPDMDAFYASLKQISDNDASGGLQKTADKVINLVGEVDKLSRAMVSATIARDKLLAGRQGFLVNDVAAQQAYEDGITEDYLRRQKILDTLRDSQAQYDAQIKQSMARTPQEKASAAIAVQKANVIVGEDPDIRAQRIQLAGAQALIVAEHDLQLAREDRVRTSQASLAAAQNELSLIGKTIAEQNRLRAAYEAEAQIREVAARGGNGADQKEIDNARAKAAAIADVNAQVAAGKLLQDQGYQTEQLRLEADLIGKSVDERNRATAALQAEQQLRQQGIDLLSREGQQYVDNAKNMADARTQIDRQNAAYQSLQQAQGSVIDDLLTGTGTLKDSLKAAAADALKFVQQLGANSVKNALTGTNLPTLGDLFSGKPSVPGATTTGAMNVTAAVVNVNGGVPGLPGVGGLAGILGYNPANSNVPGIGKAPVLPVERLPLPSIYDRQDGTAPAWAAAANAGLTKTGIPLSTISGPNGTHADVNAQYAGNFQGLVGDLQARGYQIDSLGGYNYRNIANSDRLSNHAFGNAIDVNPKLNPVSYPGQPMVTQFNPADATELSQKWGMNWGGDWKSKQDPMHFEVAKGAQPMALQQTNANLTKFSSNLSSTTKDISNLGDSSTDVSKSLMDAFGSNSSLTKAVAPTAAVPSAGFFPPAPAAAPSFNPLSLFSSIFSLFGFADGTDSAPGGPAFVNERGVGSEVINLPRGSQVIPAHKVDAYLGKGSGGGPTTVRHEYNITVGGNGDKELMERVYTVVDTVARGQIESYRQNGFGADIDKYQSDNYARG